jgi:hypothetical protein
LGCHALCGRLHAGTDAAQHHRFLVGY